MDVRCSTCREPWDTFHLWHEAIFETDLPRIEKETWNSLSQSEKLNSSYREAFRRAGWEFGKSVINITRCTVCEKGKTADSEIVETKALLEDLLGTDEDGLAAKFEDYGLYSNPQQIRCGFFAARFPIRTRFQEIEAERLLASRAK